MKCRQSQYTGVPWGIGDEDHHEIWNTTKEWKDDPQFERMDVMSEMRGHWPW